MILRARVKKLEDMPPGVPCCERMKEWLTNFTDEIKVMPGNKKLCHCQACGKKFLGMRIYGMRGWRIDPRAWDIEEAPLAKTT